MNDQAFTERLRRNFIKSVGTPEEKAEVQKLDIIEHGPAAMARKLADANSTIEGLIKDVVTAGIQRNRAEADVKELREERERAAESMAKLQAKIDERETTNTALAYERDTLRHDKEHLQYRLATERKRVEIAAKCLGDGGCRTLNATCVRLENALMVLEEKDLRRECEDCGGPCDVKGESCLLCGHEQPPLEERCPPRPGCGAAIPKMKENQE